MSVLSAVAGAISTASLVAVIHYVWSAHFQPQAFVRRAHIQSVMSPLKWIYFGLAWLGVAIFIYGGTKSALFWIPYDWGWTDEDGDVQPLRSYFAVAAAVVLTFPVLGFIYRAAADRWDAIERKSPGS